VGKMLGRLFERAIRLGKAVRKQTPIGESPVSVSSIALDLAARVFGSLEGRTLLVVGAGEMGRHTAILARHRRTGRITVCNRTETGARDLALAIGGDPFPWNDLDLALRARRHRRHGHRIAGADHRPGADGARDAQTPQPPDLRHRHRRAPRRRSVDRFAVQPLPYDLDDLTSAGPRQREASPGRHTGVQAMIEKDLADLEKWQRELRVVPTITSLRERVESIRTKELEEHLRRMHSLDEHDRNMSRRSRSPLRASCCTNRRFVSRMRPREAWISATRGRSSSCSISDTKKTTKTRRTAMTTEVRIGTRGSALAVWQAERSATLLRRHHLGIAVEIVRIKTRGDVEKTTALHAIGGKGLLPRRSRMRSWTVGWTWPCTAPRICRSAARRARAGRFPR